MTMYHKIWERFLRQVLWGFVFLVGFTLLAIPASGIVYGLLFLIQYSYWISLSVIGIIVCYFLGRLIH